MCRFYGKIQGIIKMKSGVEIMMKSVLFSCGRLRGRILFCLALCLAMLACSAAAETEPAPAQISRTPFGSAPVTVSVLLPDPADTEDWQGLIRYYPFDTQAGLYETGEGTEAGDRAVFGGWTEEGTVYTVTLNTPGKYLLSGVPFYVLDETDEAVREIREEIENAVFAAEGKNQAETAKKLYTWLLKRVKSVLPEERAGELRAACTDPLNCLLTGYALPEAYAPLYRLLLQIAGIESVPVRGTRDGEGHTWVMARLDGEWLYMDPAADDEKDKAGAKAFAMNAETLAKRWTLSDSFRDFAADRIHACVADAFFAGDAALLRRVAQRTEGWSRYGDEYGFFAGKQYSLGPSGEVTGYRMVNNTARGTADNRPAEQKAREFLGIMNPWMEEYQAFVVMGGDFSALPQEGDCAVLDWSEDLTRFTVEFNRPGCYEINGSLGCFYVLDPADENQVRAAAMLDEALETCRGETETETARNLYQWVAAHVTYDHATYRIILKSGGYCDATEYPPIAATADPISLVINGSGVCSGYAALYQLLLRSAGIPCWTVTGQTTSHDWMYHAWNVARIDGEWKFFDVTWDDKGKTAGSRYFAVSYDKIRKDHIPDEGLNYLLETMVMSRIYDRLIIRFRQDYAPFQGVPEAIAALKPSAADYGAPPNKPKFYRPLRDITKTEAVVDPGGKPKEVSCTLLRWTGETDYDRSIGFERYQPFPYTLNCNSRILRYTVRDYEERVIPTNRMYIDQTEVVCLGEVQREEFNAHVPMKKNEVRGYGEGSLRTWTYDRNMNLTAFETTLVNDSGSAAVKVYFDGEGKTRAYRITRQPAGKDDVSWTVDLDGHVTEVRYVSGEQYATLADITGEWKSACYDTFRRNLYAKYKEAVDSEHPPEEGCRVYSFSAGDDQYYGGKAIITRDDLFRWNEDGRLELNPEATDILGNPVDLEKLGFKADLSLTERLH